MSWGTPGVRLFNGINNLAMASSEEEFRARVVARAAELGRSVRSVLIEAGVALDILDKVPTSGRRVDTLAKIAGALQWTLPQLMGFGVLGRISEDIVAHALTSARRGLRQVPDAEEVEAAVVTFALNVLLALRQDGRPIDASALDMLERAIAEAWGVVGSPRSAAGTPPDAPPPTPNATTASSPPRARKKPK